MMCKIVFVITLFEINIMMAILRYHGVVVVFLRLVYFRPNHGRPAACDVVKFARYIGIERKKYTAVRVFGNLREHKIIWAFFQFLLFYEFPD